MGSGGGIELNLICLVGNEDMMWDCFFRKYFRFLVLVRLSVRNEMKEGRKERNPPNLLTWGDSVGLR